MGACVMLHQHDARPVPPYAREYGSPHVAGIRGDLRRAMKLRDDLQAELELGIGYESETVLDTLAERVCRLDRDCVRLAKALHTAASVAGQAVMP